MPKYHLAQLNIARALHPMDAPQMQDFADNLEAINGLAESMPGFVWRLQDESGDATSIQAYEDPLMLVNLTVWESTEALQEFVYRSDHRQFFVRRAEWFEAPQESNYVLWWIPAGHIPDIAEAQQKLDDLRRYGESRNAFSFRKKFDPPGE